MANSFFCERNKHANNSSSYFVTWWHIYVIFYVVGFFFLSRILFLVSSSCTAITLLQKWSHAWDIMESFSKCERVLCPLLPTLTALPALGSFQQHAGTGPFPPLLTPSQDSAVHPVRQSGFPGTPRGCLMTMPVTLGRVSQQLRSAKHPVPAPRGAGAPAASQRLQQRLLVITDQLRFFANCETLPANQATFVQVFLKRFQGRLNITSPGCKKMVDAS